jgi:hypothetical protein
MGATSQSNAESTADRTSADCSLAQLSDEQRRTLLDADKQKEYAEAYRRQMSRLSCPGCGESPVY